MAVSHLTNLFSPFRYDEQQKLLEAKKKQALADYVYKRRKSRSRVGDSGTLSPPLTMTVMIPSAQPHLATASTTTMVTATRTKMSAYQEITSPPQHTGSSQSPTTNEEIAKMEKREMDKFIHSSHTNLAALRDHDFHSPLQSKGNFTPSGSAMRERNSRQTSPAAPSGVSSHQLVHYATTVSNSAGQSLQHSDSSEWTEYSSAPMVASNSTDVVSEFDPIHSNSNYKS